MTIRRRFNQSVLHHFMEKYTIYRLFTSDIRDVRYRNVVGRLRCPRILPGWRLDLSLRRECRYFINYIHRTSDVGRACVSSRRDVSRHAKHDGNRMPPSSLLFVSLSSSLFLSQARVSCSLDDVRHPSWYASPQTIRMTRRKNVRAVLIVGI